MKTIFDPVNQWLTKAPLVLSQSNKKPVAIDDVLSVLKDSGPVSVNVLANDFDPEGRPLTLIAANAALGTAFAEANNTVTYTPPAGISGFDTVVYEIADDLDQRQTGQINITVNEPALTIDVTPDNMLVVNAETGAIDVTITTPAALAGTYPANTADLSGGPINLVPPQIVGTAETVGDVLSAADGLWIYDVGAGEPTQTWQWLRAGAEIAGATATTYTATAADIGQGISVREVLSDAFGQRFASSVTVGAAFTPTDDPNTIGWWDADDAASITHNGGLVSGWGDKTGGADLAHSVPARQPSTGTRTLNGRNVIDFDGSRFLERPQTLPASGDVAFHMALVIDGVSNAFEALLALDAASDDFQIDSDNVSQFDGRLNPAGIGSAVSFTGGPFSGALILSAVFDRTGAGQAEVFISDTTRATMGYTAPIATSAALHLMTNRSQNAWVDGAVAELVITSSTANRESYHTYLSDKWGLT